LRSHFGKLKLHALKLVDRLAKLLPLAGVANGRVQRAARDPNHLGSDTDSSFIQGLDRNLVAFPGFA
jgi:hypothetical protein